MFKRSVAIGAFALLIASTVPALAQQHRQYNKKHEPKSAQPTQPPSGAKKPEVTLKVGDAAPALKVKWVKGEEVASFQPGRVYVVEFWATWCVPCKDSIPHLTELQKKYKDVAIIGVASSERAPAADQADKRLETLEKFVKDQGAKMDYRIAYDATRETGGAWLTAAGQTTIPTAFIVDGNGKIAYIGYPDRMGEKLAAVVKANNARSGEKPSDKSNSPKPTPTPTPDKKK